MKKTQQKWFSWRLKLILVLGSLGGLILVFSGQYVASISDEPIGPTPLSWKFKSNSAQVKSAFDTGEAMYKKSQLTRLKLPVIDQAVPDETAFALFALG